MPDPPKQSFFKGFFGGGVKQLDRDELFGEGKASSTVAQVTQGDAIKGLTVNYSILLFSSSLIFMHNFRQIVLVVRVKYSKQKC